MPHYQASSEVVLSISPVPRESTFSTVVSLGFGIAMLILFISMALDGTWHADEYPQFYHS